MVSRGHSNVVSEDEFKEKLQIFFSKHGYVVHEIQRNNEDKRADFLLEDETVRVLLELKIKEDNPEDIKNLNNALDIGEVHDYEDSSTRRNRLSALIRKGVFQLLDTPESANFHLLWLHGTGMYAEHHAKRFTTTLYGSRLVVPKNKPSDIRWCYYFEDSDFFRHCEILAGAIVSSGRNCQLCINDLYSYATSFRNSSFRRIFDQEYCDPTESKQNNQAYIVDSNVDRRDKSAVLTYLRDKYNCGSFLDLDIPLSRFSIRSDSPSITGGND